MPMRDPKLARKDISQPFTSPSQDFRSPEDDLTLWQWMTVSWMSPLITIGSSRQVNPDDVWRLPYEFQHQHLHEAFRALKGRVVRRLIRANWIDLLILGSISLVELTANYSSPLLLQQLLKAMERIPTVKGPAISYAVLTLFVRYLATQSAVFSLWYSRKCYERSRGEMITMIYEKTLHRKIIGGVTEQGDQKADVDCALDVGGLDMPHDSPEDGDQIDSDENEPLLNAHAKEMPTMQRRALDILSNLRNLIPCGRRKEKSSETTGPASMGKILNMMRNDVYEVAQRFWEFPTLINQPIGFVLSFALIWRLIGWPCLFGVAVVLIAQVLNAILAKILVSWETVRRKATDNKLQQISQYIEAIRHLRYYAWHPSWLDGIMTARQKELNLKIVTSLWNTAILFVNVVSSGILPLTAFWAYTTLKGDRLTVDIAFPALQLFGLLQSNLREIPRLITVLLNAYVAVGRIEAFMEEPDKDETESAKQRFGEELEAKNAFFAWPGTTKPVLKDVSLTFPSGLTVVYGQVAAGKSALLQALLGELDVHSGELIRPSSAVAYCSQTPWLQSMSIRENILFGSPYDESRYKETLNACALVTDLAAFQHGDLSPIGENGIGLSGGQKMRVALARAVYSRADTLLLDDPLSALDQQTAEHIVKHCFRGALSKGRTLILVTHRVDLCINVAEQIVELVEGKASIQDGRKVSLPDYALSPSHSRQQTTSQEQEAQERDEAAAVPDKFEDEEHRAQGGVQVKVYWEYVKAGRLIWWAAVFLSSAACRVIIYGQSWFLKEWSEAYKDTILRLFIVQNQYTTFDNPSTPISRLFENFPDPGKNPYPWLLGFLVLVLLDAFLYLVAMIFSIVLTYTSGKKMFQEIMTKVSNTTFRFYDVTPIGRLMNRLTSDMGTIDGGISDVLLYCLWQIVSWTASVSIIAFVTPVFLIAVVVLTISFVLIFLRFIPTSQSLRRLEMVSLSPLMSNFGALLEGLMTVRAFCAQKQFQDRIIVTTDAFQQMDHFYWSLQAWLMFRFDLLSAVSTLILTLIAIYSGLSPGLTAFVLIAAGKFVQATHSLCRQYGRLQLDFVAVERVVELMHLDQEPRGTVQPPASWPSTTDAIVFEDVTIRYAPHLEPALNNLSFTLPGGSSTAVIGRTGSGKSTLALALLATTLPSSGRILIGGIDISTVSKQALRSRVTFLAQDPVLFPGSLRHNLDPMAQHTDEECSAVLDRVCGAYGFTLDTEVDTGGKNLSQGQRQLVGLARAILRRSSIVIMDEATASIDAGTAWEIQRVLREELVGSTVVTIAHRPGAVRGAGLCLKLKEGRVEGFGSVAEVMGDVEGGEM
ncbi:ATP-dependent bile acid permease [Sphaceloma murrayae]|uniref:ATP-dependent bile acid permease n=1 Tax=Sphaceloma murrayae TaxID=2082308 RepID=A0A2K1QG64_9PEZI|nr:ATP-dependent bile acid permease [Sphaceloma murrayae]